MSALPRGTCPSCGASVALRKGGLVREHRFVIGRWQSGREVMGGTCPGSGQPAKKARSK